MSARRPGQPGAVSREGLPLGVQALASHPMKTEKRGLGEVDVPVAFAGVSVTPGDWIYADANGVIVANMPLL